MAILDAAPRARGTAPSTLVLSDRVRRLTHAGGTYVHVAGVPLVYMSAGPELLNLIDAFTTPDNPDQVVERFEGADAETVGSLIERLRMVGVLVDAHGPDPIHAFRGRAGAVREITLFPTNSCNLRCLYCYATSGPGSGPRLSVEHALSSVDAFFEELTDEVEAVGLNFHGGGEPTTNFGVMQAAWEHFRELAHARGLRCRVATISNGTFGPAVLRELVKPEWSVLISYDGPGQDANRPTAAGTGSRDRVTANIRALAAAGKRVHTRATITASGVARLRELVDDAAELGIHEVLIEPSSPVGRGGLLVDGQPDAHAFAEAYLDAFDYALSKGVRLRTSGWTSARPGDGAYCGAQTGLTQVTPDGFISCCTESTDGKDMNDPFIVGRLDPVGPRLEIWPVKDSTMRSRIGYSMPSCASCAFVDTCAGGCASKARINAGDALARDVEHCVASKRINPEMISAVADGRLLPDAGWQPIVQTWNEEQTGVPGLSGRLVALIPPFARRRWNADPRRRPMFPAAGSADPFFHRPNDIVKENVK